MPIGIFGGNDLKFIRKYVAFAENFLDSNLSYLTGDAKALNIIVEQYFLYILAKRHAKSIHVHIDIPTVPQSMYHYTNFPACRLLSNYIHIMGGKNYTTTLDQMEWKIKLDFPETYKIITSICKPRSGAKIERRNFRSMNQYQRSTAFLKTLTPVKFAKINNGSRIGVKVLCSKYKVSKNLVKKWIEIFEFETFKIQFKESVLKNKDKIILKIQKNIQYLESLKLSNKIMDSTISLSKFSGIFDCDYYWAEKREFKNQVESTFEIDDNLNAAPSLYRVLLLNMANQNDVLEYVCDQIDLIITDILNAEKKCSINGLILQFQNRMNGETIFLSQIKDQILNKILFFIWHGVVDIKL